MVKMNKRKLSSLPTRVAALAAALVLIAGVFVREGSCAQTNQLRAASAARHAGKASTDSRGKGILSRDGIMIGDNKPTTSSTLVSGDDTARVR